MSFAIGMATALTAGGAWIALRSYFRIEEGHRAIITSFGRPTGSQVGAGFHWKKPWQRVHEFSIMERILPLRTNEREVELLARDGTVLRMDPKLRFRFSAQEPEKFVFGMKRPMGHLRELFRSLLANEVARFGDDLPENGSYAEIRRHRTLLGKYLERDSTDNLRAKYGVEAQATELTEILPPADLAEALNSVQRAEAENETALSRIQADCEQKIAGAEHGVHIARMRAEATETEIVTLGEAVTKLHKDGVLPAYLKRRQDEASSLSKTLYMKS